jgi:hypothetical protein
MCSVWSIAANAQAPATGSFPSDERAAPAPTPPPAATPAPALGPAPAPPPGDSAAPLPAAPAAPPAATAPAVTPPPPPEPISEPPIPENDEREAHEYSGQHVSITFSPIHLLLPLFEAQVEVLVVPHFGLAAIGGYGSIKADAADSSLGNQKFSAYELGAQAVGYPLREFSSLQLGAELMYIHVSAENINGQQVDAAAGGGAVGPFVGYKVLTQAGFTFFVQGGFQYVFVKASANDNAGNSASAEQNSVIPLLNLNLGWSF